MIALQLLGNMRTCLRLIPVFDPDSIRIDTEYCSGTSELNSDNNSIAVRPSQAVISMEVFDSKPFPSATGVKATYSQFSDTVTDMETTDSGQTDCTVKSEHDIDSTGMSPDVRTSQTVTGMEATIVDSLILIWELPTVDQQIAL